MSGTDSTLRPNAMVVRGQLVLARRAHGRIVLAAPEATPTAPTEPVRRPARVAQMLALAHHIERSIEAGIYSDRADAARHLDLTRARVTQLCDLLVLAPDIQEELLFLESVDGVEPTTERALRPLLRTLSWRDQRAAWRKGE